MAEEDEKLKNDANATDASPLAITSTNIKNLIYEIRGKQVMLDSDLAMLYQVETKRLNESVRRNRKRFPESFCFQLNDEELESLMSQFATSKETDSLRSQISTSNGRGGRRYKPHVFTEQGVAMLSAVLRSDEAIQTSIAIMNAFVEMRRFIAGNSGLLQRMDVMERRQLEYEQKTDKKFEKVFGCLEAHEEKQSSQAIFFEGQIYDAFQLLTKIVRKARKNIILIDGYVGLGTLNILAKKRKSVTVKIYTTQRGNKLTDADVEKFNEQYPELGIVTTDAFHDRFLILDEKIGYHVGASIKDAGKRCFGISAIEDEALVHSILERLR